MPQLVHKNGYLAVVVHRPDLAQSDSKLAPFIEPQENLEEDQEENFSQQEQKRRQPCFWLSITVLVAFIVVGVILAAVFLTFGRTIEHIFVGLNCLKVSNWSDPKVPSDCLALRNVTDFYSTSEIPSELDVLKPSTRIFLHKCSTVVHIN